MVVITAGDATLLVWEQRNRQMSADRNGLVCIEVSEEKGSAYPGEGT